MKDLIVDIIDTKDNTHVLSLEKALRKSIVLEWKGSDRNDDLCIIGSTLSFSMIYQGVNDGTYYDLFTGDETRFKVRLYDELNTTIWSGFLLPDSYSEPFSHTQIVEFAATDGLGRLKGKYLPSAYYEDEQSVIDVLAQCLKLTGLSLDFRFSPAIENAQQKDYKLIFVDTLAYVDKDKKQDAYKILEGLLESMFCSVYQCENYFNIEGLNIRNQKVYKTKVYNVHGDYQREEIITRNIKSITGVATPEIAMQAPYGVVEVTHERELLEYDESIYKEENDGWVINNPQFSEDSVSGIYPTAWFAYNGAELKANDNGIALPYNADSSQYMLPKEKIYIEQNQKYRLKMDFQFNILDSLYLQGELKTAIDNGVYDNPFEFTISTLYINEIHGEIRRVLLTNNQALVGDVKYKSLRPDEEDYKVVIDFTFIPTKSGVLDIRLGAVQLLNQNLLMVGVTLENLEIEKLGQKEEEVFTNILAEDYTFKKEVDLEYSDDNTGLSKSFILKKLRLKGAQNTINIPIIRKFEFQGFFYNVVDLRGANIIKDNPAVFNQYLMGTVKLVDVIYNYNGSQEHVVKTSEAVAFDSILAVMYDTLPVTENRDYWQEWSDSFYGIERKRYAEVVLDLFKRGYNVPIPIIQDFTLKNNCKLNDFIIFPYRNKTEWILTNCKWNIDTGYTSVSCSQRYYVVREGELLPPTVDAGPDIYFSEGETVTLTSEARDPDGYIVKYQWREITNNGPRISRPNHQNTNIDRLYSDYYEFEVTVTDNDGLTATDTVKMYKDQATVVSFDLVYTNPAFPRNGEGVVLDDELENHYKFICSPDISEGTSLNLKGRFEYDSNSVDLDEGYFEIFHNGIKILELNRNYNAEFSINYIGGDELIFKLSVGAIYNTGSNSFVEIKAIIEEINFIDGVGSVTGHPITGLCRVQQTE